MLHELFRDVMQPYPTSQGCTHDPAWTDALQQTLRSRKAAMEKKSKVRFTVEVDAAAINGRVRIGGDNMPSWPFWHRAAADLPVYIDPEHHAVKSFEWVQEPELGADCSRWPSGGEVAMRRVKFTVTCDAEKTNAGNGRFALIPVTDAAAPLYFSVGAGGIMVNPDHTDVELEWLPEPEDIRVGDVVLSAVLDVWRCGAEGTLLFWQRTGSKDRYPLDYLARPLTLLVRDGKPVKQ